MIVAVSDPYFTHPLLLTRANSFCPGTRIRIRVKSPGSAHGSGISSVIRTLEWPFQFSRNDETWFHFVSECTTTDIAQMTTIRQTDLHLCITGRITQGLRQHDDDRILMSDVPNSCYTYHVPEGLGPPGCLATSTVAPGLGLRVQSQTASQWR